MGLITGGTDGRLTTTGAQQIGGVPSDKGSLGGGRKTSEHLYLIKTEKKDDVPPKPLGERDRNVGINRQVKRGGSNSKKGGGPVQG